MAINSIEELVVPEQLQKQRKFNSLAEEKQWELELIAFFSQHSQLFTPFPKFFKVRSYEFMILKQLLPEIFNLELKHKKILEIGCGYGFKTLLLSHMCESIIGIDIPVKYSGYVKGDYSSSVEIAEIIVNEKFKLENTEFKALWPDKLESIADESISLVFSEYVLEHIPDLATAIKEMYRVMEKGGTMVHIVPNTKDAVIQFMKAQMNVSLGSYVKEVIKKLLGRKDSQISGNGTMIPQCHSEFIDDYNQQIEIYSLENYLFPMLEAGFTVTKIISTREHNNVVILRK